jgi:hypothetical protein
VSGADRLGCAAPWRPEWFRVGGDRECGFAGSERFGAQHRGCLALSLAARRRLVCVCNDNNSRRNARAANRPGRNCPHGAAWQERNAAHHHYINLVAWQRSACASFSHDYGIFARRVFLAHHGANLRFLAVSA